jgi:acyl-CoA synthetase (AMP-forming)/AMP-acid ligase II
VALRDDADLTDEDLRQHATDTLAGYKVPRRFVRTEQVRRGPNGKVDYRWANALIGAIQ